MNILFVMLVYLLLFSPAIQAGGFARKKTNLHIQTDGDAALGLDSPESRECFAIKRAHEFADGAFARFIASDETPVGDQEGFASRAIHPCATQCGSLDELASCDRDEGRVPFDEAGPEASGFSFEPEGDPLVAATAMLRELLQARLVIEDGELPTRHNSPSARESFSSDADYEERWFEVGAAELYHHLHEQCPALAADPSTGHPSPCDGREVELFFNPEKPVEIATALIYRIMKTRASSGTVPKRLQSGVHYFLRELPSHFPAQNQQQSNTFFKGAYELYTGTTLSLSDDELTDFAEKIMASLFADSARVI